MKRRDELTQLRGLSTSALYGKITDSQKKRVLLEQDKLLGQLKNMRELTAIKKSIARAQTILDEKLIAEVNKN